VSVCLIVRDEQSRLADCLGAVRPFASELVVCDTGSRDRTTSVAARLGARVVHTAWSDDFAAARNAALLSCRGDWVLSLDADERARGVPSWLPVLLAACGDALDALSLAVDNGSVPGLDATGVPRVHRELKLFRRDRCRWVGRVHERLVAVATSECAAPNRLRTAELPAETLSLIHHGYDDPSVAAVKAVRNARLAHQQLGELRAERAPAERIARTALDVGRSCVGAGRPDLAIDYLRTAELGGDADTRYWARRFLARIEGAVVP
jgi:glycosyltransferase involved in cell wall biosynthesis